MCVALPSAAYLQWDNQSYVLQEEEQASRLQQLVLLASESTSVDSFAAAAHGDIPATQETGQPGADAVAVAAGDPAAAAAEEKSAPEATQSRVSFLAVATTAEENARLALRQPGKEAAALAR